MKSQNALALGAVVFAVAAGVALLVNRPATGSRVAERPDGDRQQVPEQSSQALNPGREPADARLRIGDDLTVSTTSDEGGNATSAPDNAELAPGASHVDLDAALLAGIEKYASVEPEDAGGFPVFITFRAFESHMTALADARETSVSALLSSWEFLRTQYLNTTRDFLDLYAAHASVIAPSMASGGLNGSISQTTTHSQGSSQIAMHHVAGPSGSRTLVIDSQNSPHLYDLLVRRKDVANELINEANREGLLVWSE